MVGSIVVQAVTTIASTTQFGLENYINDYVKFVSPILIAGGIAFSSKNLKLMYPTNDDGYDYEKKELVTGDVYSISRNPVYLGYRVASLGSVLFNQSIENILAGVIVYIMTELTARIEENKLEHFYGAEYLEYKKKVPRWLPSHRNLRPILEKIRNSLSNYLKDPMNF